MPSSVPFPSFSISTYLQLELASGSPSPLYIHRPPAASNDFPFESSHVKLERLQNFLLLPPSLEQVLLFGSLACLDSWLYSFTILPLRFCKSVFMLCQSWAVNISAEAQFVSSFVVNGIGRVLQRRQRRRSSVGQTHQGLQVLEDVSHDQRRHAKVLDSPLNGNVRTKHSADNGRRRRGSMSRKHRRNQSVPSTLLPDDKADILKGLLMVSTCIVLMLFDASRMYHWIRGQAAIKLYVIYNVLEVSLCHHDIEASIL